MKIERTKELTATLAQCKKVFSLARHKDFIMPKRTNPFQKLVLLLQKVLQPSNVELTESEMLYSPELGVFREIDVLATTTDKKFNAKIAIEAKNHGRKLTLPDIETICGRFRVNGSLKVDEVIVVSRRGFTKSAKKMAALNGIRLLILDKSTVDDW